MLTPALLLGLILMAFALSLPDPALILFSTFCSLTLEMYNSYFVPESLVETRDLHCNASSLTRPYFIFFSKQLPCLRKRCHKVSGFPQLPPPHTKTFLSHTSTRHEKSPSQGGAGAWSRTVSGQISCLALEFWILIRRRTLKRNE